MKLSRLTGLLLAVVAVQSVDAGAASAAAAASTEIKKSDFFAPGDAPVRPGQADDVTIVYFFDYQCPTCRKYHADVAKALREDRKVRVIYRDTPMLGDKSDAAAYAAIAAKFQGRHAAMHDALMSSKVALDEAGIRAAAQKANVDWDRLQRDIKQRKASIDALITRNFELATEVGVYGTPAFIVGDSLANGALDYAGLKGEIADARKALKSTEPVAAPTPPAELDPKEAEADEVAATPAGAIFEPGRAATDDSFAIADSGESTRSFPQGWLALAGGLVVAVAAALMLRRRRAG